MYLSLQLVQPEPCKNLSFHTLWEEKQTCNIMGNCPKLRVSLIIGPSLY